MYMILAILTSILTS